MVSRNAVPRRVWFFVWAGAFVAAAVIALVTPSALRQVRGGDWPMLWQSLSYAVGLVLAERFVVAVPLRNHRFVVGVTDMVVVVGIVASQLLNEPQAVKRLFNSLQYVLSVAAAATLTTAVLDVADRVRPFGVSVAADHGFKPSLAFAWVIGMIAFFLLNHSMVAAAVSLSVGQGFGPSWRRAAPVAAAGSAAGTAYGLLIASLLSHERTLLPLLVIPIGLTLLGNRAWVRILAQGQRMHSLYGAGRALSNGLGEVDAWRDFVGLTAEVLNCEGAAVFLGRPDDGALDVISTQGGPDRLMVSASPTAWEQATKGYITRSHWRRAVTVTMEAEGRVVGYAVAYGPRVESD